MQRIITRNAALTLGLLLVVFAVAGALIGWFIGYPVEGIIFMAALHFLFLVVNGDNVDARVEENTNEHLQGINKTILSLPAEKQEIALNDIKRLGDKAKHLSFIQKGQLESYCVLKNDYHCRYQKPRYLH